MAFVCYGYGHKKGGSVIVMRRRMSECASTRSKCGIKTWNPPQSESMIKNYQLEPHKAVAEVSKIGKL